MAHPVKKQSRFEWIKAELLRAQALLHDRSVEGLLDEVCAEAPPPPFLEVALTQSRQRRESRAESFSNFGE